MKPIILSLLALTRQCLLRCRDALRKNGKARFHWSLSAGLVTVAALLLQRPWMGHAHLSATPVEIPSVAAARVEREDLYREITVPAEFRPYAEVELHAKVAGYLDQINVDFGDRVKEGQLLATLEVPELKDELNRAVAAEKRAAVDHQDAHLVYTRLCSVNREHPNLVAQQELDTAETRDASTEAALAAASADKERYQTLMRYTRITAPFDGVITRRYADRGSLIQAGTASDTQSMPVVRLSDNYHLRMDFPVSVDYVKDIQPGDALAVRIESLGGRTFTGRISRFTQRVDEATRTMIAEMEVDNSKLELVPGMYATAVLKVQQRPHALAIPTEAIAAGSKTVEVVNARDEVEERAVTLGLETPTKYEVLSGLNEGDRVVIGNAGRVKPGQRVEAKLVSLMTAE